MISLWTMFAGVSLAAPPEGWWSDFQDPALAQVVERVLTENLDLNAARARLEAAEAIADVTRAKLGPAVSIDAQGSMAPMDSLGFQFDLNRATEDSPSWYWTGSTYLSARWSVDLWGANTLGWLASRADAEAARLDLEQSSMTLVGSAVHAYLDWVTVRQQRAILDEQIHSGEALLELVSARHAAASATSLDVLSQRQSLAAARAQRPTLLLAERQAAATLCALLGSSDSLDLPVADALPVPPPLADVPPAPPPQVAAAEARALAAHRKRLQTERAFLPTVSLSASTGMQYSDTGELRTQDTWSAGTSVSLPVMNSGLLLAQRASARASERVALAQAEKAALDAALALSLAADRETYLQERLLAVQTQAGAARAAYDTSVELYLSGLARYSEVLQSRNAWQAAEITGVLVQREVLGARVSRHLARGERTTITPPAQELER